MFNQVSANEPGRPGHNHAHEHAALFQRAAFRGPAQAHSGFTLSVRTQDLKPANVRVPGTADSETIASSRDLLSWREGSIIRRTISLGRAW
jgi:hypothetical protein